MTETQGTVSNTSGHAFEAEVASLLADSGFQFRYQVRDPELTDALGESPRLDFVVETNTGPVVVECKWHGELRGSIGQKLAYTRDWLSELPIPAVIVLGGDWPVTVVARVRAHLSKYPNVDLLSFDEFRIWIRNR